MYPATPLTSLCLPGAASSVASVISDVPLEAISSDIPCSAYPSDDTCSSPLEGEYIDNIPIRTNLENFDVEGFKAGMGTILLHEPMISDENGSHETNIQPMNTLVEQYLKGIISFPRLESLHRLLCGGREPSDVRVVENGGADILTNALVWAAMGSQVTLKEPDRLTGRMLQYQLSKLPPDIRSLIVYLGDHKSIHKSHAADIAYWVNPTPFIPRGKHDEHEFKPHHSDAELLEYMGRDVIHGGFLVIQSDRESFSALQFNRGRWDRIYSAVLDRTRGTGGTVFNTTHYNQTNAITIYRRR